MTVWGQCSHSTTILCYCRTCSKRFRAQIGCLESTHFTWVTNNTSNRKRENMPLSYPKRWLGNKPLLGCMKGFGNGTNSPDAYCLIEGGSSKLYRHPLGGKLTLRTYKRPPNVFLMWELIFLPQTKQSRSVPWEKAHHHVSISGRSSATSCAVGVRPCPDDGRVSYTTADKHLGTYGYCVVYSLNYDQSYWTDRYSIFSFFLCVSCQFCIPWNFMCQSIGGCSSSNMAILINSNHPCWRGKKIKKWNWNSNCMIRD